MTPVCPVLASRSLCCGAAEGWARMPQTNVRSSIRPTDAGPRLSGPIEAASPRHTTRRDALETTDRSHRAGPGLRREHRRLRAARARRHLHADAAPDRPRPRPVRLRRRGPDRLLVRHPLGAALGRREGVRDPAVGRQCERGARRAVVVRAAPAQGRVWAHQVQPHRPQPWRADRALRRSRGAGARRVRHHRRHAALRQPRGRCHQDRHRRDRHHRFRLAGRQRFCQSVELPFRRLRSAAELRGRDELAHHRGAADFNRRFPAGAPTSTCGSGPRR